MYMCVYIYISFSLSPPLSFPLTLSLFPACSDKVMSLDKWCISSSAANLLKEEEKEKRTKGVDGRHPGGAPASGAEAIGGGSSASSLVDGCLIMAEGRLYCNRAALADESYKAQVSRFVKKGEAAGQLVHGEPLRMDECKLSDMNLELGASYIMCHAGSCEHILRVTALRMHCCLDPGEWGPCSFPPSLPPCLPPSFLPSLPPFLTHTHP